MTDKHSFSFFGQSVGLTIQSASKSEPFVFFRFIKNRNGIWEKPSNGEGKTIKFSLEEIVMIIKVMKNEINSWRGHHQFKGNRTDISLEWENQQNKLWINVDSYSKLLNLAQIEIMKLLMEHLLKEKIQFATTSNISQSTNTNLDQKNSELIIEENVIENSIPYSKKEQTDANSKKNEITGLKGLIKGETQKALLINFEKGEIWIPKSTIHSQFTNEKHIVQNFLIDSWILKKNKVLS